MIIYRTVFNLQRGHEYMVEMAVQCSKSNDFKSRLTKDGSVFFVTLL